jgi:hypothetical protein
VAQTAPDFCDTVREQRFFQLGVRKGRNAAQQAIAAVQEDAPDCPSLERLDELEAILRDIADRLDVPADFSDAVQCHVVGQAAGLIAEIVDFQDECLGFCIADGQFVGEVSAHLYCELSIALGGLGLADLFERLATDTCGTQFQDACDDAFEATAIDFPECAEFTVAPFEDVFALTQNNQCAANPGPDP